jgi:hypothetical protein
MLAAITTSLLFLSEEAGPEFALPQWSAIFAALVTSRLFLGVAAALAAAVVPALALLIDLSVEGAPFTWPVTCSSSPTCVRRVSTLPVRV